MKPNVRITLILLLVSAGWAFGRAQTSEPHFVLRVEAFSGGARIVCERGCNLRSFRGPTSVAPQPEFNFGCSNPECRATIHGFVKR
jgi:hypothetical protein